MQDIVITLVIVYNYYFIHELLRKRLQFQDYELKCDLKKNYERNILPWNEIMSDMQ